jgi:hypothetical protein
MVDDSDHKALILQFTPASSLFSWFFLRNLSRMVSAYVLLSMRQTKFQTHTQKKAKRVTLTGTFLQHLFQDAQNTPIFPAVSHTVTHSHFPRSITHSHFPRSITHSHTLPFSPQYHTQSHTPIFPAVSHTVTHSHFPRSITHSHTIPFSPQYHTQWHTPIFPAVSHTVTHSQYYTMTHSPWLWCHYLDSVNIDSWATYNCIHHYIHTWWSDLARD